MGDARDGQERYYLQQWIEGQEKPKS